MLEFAKATLVAIGAVLGANSHIHDITTCLNISTVSPSPHHITDHFHPVVNEFFDDDTTEFADSISDDPNPHHGRFSFVNLDSMRNDLEEMDYNLSVMQGFKSDVFGFADPSLNLNDNLIASRYRQQATRRFEHSKSSLSSSNIDCDRDSGYKPGGTITTAAKQWSSRCNGEEIVDPRGLGRWSGLTFLGRRGCKLSVITGYRSPRQTNKQTYSFSDQQYALLKAEGIKQPNIRLQFIADMVKQILKLKDAKHEVMLMLDANELMGESLDGIQRLVDACDLHDLHSIHANPPATYKYGHARRIDFMLGTAAVFESVTGAGYAAFDDGIFSKHRVIFVDLDYSTLLGHVTDPTARASRRLRSCDPKLCDDYLGLLIKYLDDHKVEQRLTSLERDAPYLSSSEVKIRYDKIDRDVTRGMIHAEKQSGNSGGKYKWSPLLRESGLRTRYWRLRLLELENKFPKTIALAKLRDKLKRFDIVLDDDGSQDLDIVKARWRAALKSLRIVRDDDDKHRENHLLDLLNDYESVTKPSDEIKEKAQRVRNAIQGEEARRPFRQINFATKKPISGSISKIWVPVSVKNKKVAAKFADADGHVSNANLIKMAQSDRYSVNYETVLESEAMEDHLLRYNRKWFRQASETPFGGGDLYDMTQFSGLTHEVDAILNGNHVDDMGIPMSIEMRTFLQQMQRPANIADIETAISTDDYTYGIKGWKETTSTSPSGRHLGHYKAALGCPIVTALHVRMINLPILYGFAPERWCLSVTPLIEKEAGKPFLTRLRVIHLFEADYNLFLKIHYSRIVKNATKANALNDQAHGSRPKRQTMDALFLSRLAKDLIRQLKINGASMDNDATGCYDRIIVSLGLLAARRLGLPEDSARTQAEVLQHLRYAVKTVYGISEENYQGTILAPLFGTGQGSAASPAVWLALSVVLLNAFDKLADDGFSFRDPWHEFLAKWKVFAFVDDTSLGFVDPTHLQNVEQLTARIERSAQLWEKLLFISGGTLNLAKCFWSLQFWEWPKGRPVLRPPTRHDPDMLLYSGEAPTATIIKYVDNDVATRMLGVFMNFTGTFQRHADEMQAKADSLAIRLDASSLSTQLSFQFYQSMYRPAMRYSLPVTSMTQQQLGKIQQRFIRAMLNKMGFNQNYPRAVAFAPRKVLGGGLMDLRIEEGLQNMLALINHVGTSQPTGEAMLISLSHAQLEAGVGYHLLDHSSTTIPHLTDCWIAGLRRFLGRHSISIHLRQAKMVQLARESDQYIMELAMETGFTTGQLTDINLVRLFLRVVTLSDISTATGAHLAPEAWEVRTFQDRTSSLEWPRQPQPTSSQRTLWRKLLKRSFLLDEKHKGDLKLRHPMGPWVGFTTHMDWKYNVGADHLYVRLGSNSVGICDQAVARYATRSHHRPFPILRQTTYQLECQATARTVPRHTVPGHAHSTKHLLIQSMPRHELSSLELATTWDEWRVQLPPAEYRIVHYFERRPIGTDQYMIPILGKRHRKLYLGTDGGLKDFRGSLAWIMLDKERRPVWRCAGPVDCWVPAQSSQRCELFAIASFMVLLDDFCTYYRVILCCTIYTYVDNDGAMEICKALQDGNISRTYPDNADAIAIIASRPKVLKRMHFIHVDSHQDKKQKYKVKGEEKKKTRDLPMSAKLNYLADRLATQFLKTCRWGEWCPTQYPLRPPSVNVTVVSSGYTITNHYVKTIRNQIGIRLHRDYLHDKYKWSEQTWTDIAWDAYHAAAEAIPLTQLSTHSKLAHGWLDLGTHRQKLAASLEKEAASKCPCCLTATEDFQHLLTCPDPRSTKTRYEAYEQLRMALRHHPGGAYLTRAIKTWTADPTTPPPVPISCSNLIKHKAQVATNEQTGIGWENLFKGFIAIGWGYVHFERRPILKGIESAIALQKVIVKSMWLYTITIWKARNDILHADTVETKAIVHLRVNTTIRQIYEDKEKFKDSDRLFFKIPLQRILRRSLRAKRRWLFLVQPVVDRATERANDRSLPGKQQRITSYLPTRPNTTPSTRDPHRIPITPSHQLPTKQTTLLKDYLFTITILPTIAE